jgi:putative membrane protein
MRYSSLLPAAAVIVAVTPVASAFAQDENPGPTQAKPFVTQAAIGDMYEVQAGMLAETKASSAGVKAFGSHMVAAHTQTTANLKAALKKSGSDVTPLSQIDSKHQKMLDQLQATSGSDFDQTYLGQQEAAHQDALKLMQTYSESGDNDALKQAAAKTTRLVKSHIAMLAKLKT